MKASIKINHPVWRLFQFASIHQATAKNRYNYGTTLKPITQYEGIPMSNLDDLKNKTTEIAENLKSKAQEAQQAGGNALDQIKDFAEKDLASTKEDLLNLKDKASELKDEATTKFEDLKAQAGDKLDELKKAATDTINKFKG